MPYPNPHFVAKSLLRDARLLKWKKAILHHWFKPHYSNMVGILYQYCKSEKVISGIFFKLLKKQSKSQTNLKSSAMYLQYKLAILIGFHQEKNWLRLIGKLKQKFLTCSLYKSRQRPLLLRFKNKKMLF